MLLPPRPPRLCPASGRYIFGDPIANWNKECQCKYEYPCNDILSQEELVVFGFDAATFDPPTSISVEEALGEMGIERSLEMFYALVDDPGGISTTGGQLLEFGAKRGGCATTTWSIDTSDAMTKESNTDVTFEVALAFALDTTDGKESELTEGINGLIVTTPCSPTCGSRMSDTKYLIERYDAGESAIRQVTHRFRANSETTHVTFQPMMEFLDYAYIQSITVTKITKRFEATSTILEDIREATASFQRTCEELKPQCVPFDSAIYPFCEGIIPEGDPCIHTRFLLNLVWEAPSSTETMHSHKKL